MNDWNAGAESARVKAVTPLLIAMEQNDAAYLAGDIERDAWMDAAKAIDEKLAVAGLRLAVRPWANTR